MVSRENYGRYIIAKIIDGFWRMTKHEYTQELLYHFLCGKCKKWWSYASTKEEGITSRYMYCPHCGEGGECKRKDI